MPVLSPTSEDVPRKRSRDILSKKNRLKRPRKPKTAYNFYQLTVRPQIAAEAWETLGRSANRMTHNQHVARIIGQKWQQMDNESRRHYQEMAEKDKQRYLVAKADYDVRLQKALTEAHPGEFASSEFGKGGAIDLLQCKTEPGLKSRKLSCYSESRSLPTISSFSPLSGKTEFDFSVSDDASSVFSGEPDEARISCERERWEAEIQKWDKQNAQWNEEENLPDLPPKDPSVIPKHDKDEAFVEPCVIC